MGQSKLEVQYFVSSERRPAEVIRVLLFVLVLPLACLPKCRWVHEPKPKKRHLAKLWELVTRHRGGTSKSGWPSALQFRHLKPLTRQSVHSQQVTETRTITSKSSIRLDASVRRAWPWHELSGWAQCHISVGAQLVMGPVHPWHRFTSASWGLPVTESCAPRDLMTLWRLGQNEASV
jgi:hypothetical protein